MEYGLRLFRDMHTLKQIGDCLNPCCNGIWSQTLNKTFPLFMQLSASLFLFFFTNSSKKVHFLRGCKGTIIFQYVKERKG